MNNVAGAQGVMRCVIHQGRKDGKKAKGNAFDTVVGVGDKPGADFAALTVLHQLERGKPIERILAPEFRESWLDLDKRFEEMSDQQSKRAVNRERRDQISKRKETMDRARESVHIPTESRQLIEDAILQQKVASKSNPSNDQAAPSQLTLSQQSSGGVLKELLRMGFSLFDATYASQMFTDVSSALDYLCLNLDESELPASFAPTSDVEVVQHISGVDGEGMKLLDATIRETLTRYTCISKFAVDKAMKASNQDICKALMSLYHALTHHVLVDMFITLPSSESNAVAKPERLSEEESITAIYDIDARAGIGTVPFLKSKWAMIVNMREGCPGIGHSGSISVAFVDMDDNYPCSAPLVLISSSFTNSMTEGGMNASQRRLLMRAAAGEISSIRSSSHLDEGPPEPILIIHSVLSFLSDATEEQLLSSASIRSKSTTSTAKHEENVPPGGNVDTTKLARGDRNNRPSFRRTTEKPLPVNKVKESAKHMEMMKRRSNLPAHTSRDGILKSVRNNQVVVISGATGSGKTTQVPQFLLEEAADTREPISIICTQPRRIAAISVAERVAAERCQDLGESVGYQVKLNKKKSKSTRLLFCTTGVLLRRLQGDPSLNGLTHVLVDEVHERSVETDFLLLLLREILPSRPSLKIVLMSATLDASKFSAYFASAVTKKASISSVPVISIPGRTFPVAQFYLAEAVAFSGYRLEPGDRYAKKPKRGAHVGKYGQEPKNDSIVPMSRNSATTAAAPFEALDHDFSDSGEEESGTSGMDSSASDRNHVLEPNSDICKRSVSLIDEEQVNVDLIDALVKRIDAEGRRKQEYGAILVFLPGAAEISAVIRKISSGRGSEDLLVLPLHSLLSPDEQKKVFNRAPPQKRKVICATNIAETSITVEDVTVVIDSLRVKEMSYDSLNECSVLEEKFISKAASKQRAGRAGRVSKGICYRLVREHTFDHRLRAQQKPEIQRVALEHLVLNILSIIPDEQIQGDVGAFLNKAVDPPEGESVKTAVSSLISIGAVERINSAVGSSSAQIKLTALGKHLSHLPVDAKIGKLLIYGVMFGCFDAALTIAATVSEKSPFSAPFEKRDEAREAKKAFASGKSDLLMFVEAFNAWREICDSHASYSEKNRFCSQHFLSRKTLMAISDGRRQLADAVLDTGFCGETRNMGRSGWERDSSLNEYGSNLRVLKAVICAALYPNIVRIDLPPKKYEKVAGGNVEKPYNSKDIRIRDKAGNRLLLHPESINFFENAYATRWLAYFAKVETTKVFVRDSTMVSPYALLLFGGDIDVRHQREEMTIDKWMVFKSAPRVAVLARELRRELDVLLLQKFSDSSLDLAEAGRAVTTAIIRLITTEI